MGRVVVTHSTYIEGLIPMLKKIADHIEVKTITPGVIKRTKGKSEALGLKISTTIIGGYKLIARKGRSTQEVFIITGLTKDDLQKHINNFMTLNQ